MRAGRRPLLRTALLVALKRTNNSDLRAMLPLAGRSVLAWQVDLARQLGCERIICLCEAPQTEILELQRETEATGGEFHAVRGNLQLVTLLRADDELVMIADGLIIDNAIALEAVQPAVWLKKMVLSIPSDSAYSRENPDDFERIDADRNWAGIAVMDAVQAQKLAELPPDGDALSLLLRLALQSGVQCEPLVLDRETAQGLVLATSVEALAKRETALIEQSGEPAIWTGPGIALASELAKRLSPRGLQHGFALSLAATGSFLLSGAVFSAFGFGAFGLVLVAMGAFGSRLAAAWASLRTGLFGAPDRSGLSRIFSALVDCVAVGSLVLALAPSPGQFAVIALPLFTIGLFRLASIDTVDRVRVFWSDRALHMLVFAFAAAVGMLIPALIVSGLGALGSKLLRS